MMRDIFLQHFTYDDESGHLYWKHAYWKNIVVGKRADTFHKHKGCMIVSFKGKQYKAHRVVWSMMIGEPPPDIIDHIDRDATNNRLNNLRAATNSLNMLNTSQGVTYRRGRWRVRFQDLEETYTTYEEAVARREQLMRDEGVIA